MVGLPDVRELEVVVTIRISFADLSHTGQVVAANTFPLGSGLVVAYAKKELGDEIDVEIFKYPDDFASYLDKGMPKLACFTCFSWDIELHHEYARRIKKASPKTITIFCGCNFPDEPEVQKEFLQKYDGIDFYVEFEGELAFLELYKNLKAVNFDGERFKRERRDSPNVRYLVDGELVRCELGPKIRDLSTVPSPYLSGVLDKFFDGVLIPLIQTARGCPYHCTFCWEGGDFFTKIGRFPREQIHAEIEYIGQRIGNVPDLQIIDANFGMFKEDLDTAMALREAQQKYGWPKQLIAQTAKNNKERTMEIVELLGDAMPATAAVQTTDVAVLATIKRKNPPISQMEAMGRVVDRYGGQTEGEIVLCLPGDSRKAHFQSVADLLDIGMTFIRMYQYMLLPGSEAARRSSRREHEMGVRYRVLPRCFGYYRFLDETFGVAEIEEIVVANKTMPHEDYQACRDLNLTVEIFNNDSIFADLMFFLGRHGIRRSQFVNCAYDLIKDEDKGGPISRLYGDFRDEEQKNLRENLAELESFTRQPGIIDHYISGEYGTNELYRHRALAVFEYIEALHDVAFAAARSLLKEAGKATEQVESYLSELYRFSLMRKREPLDTAWPQKEVFHFDFVTLLERRFTIDPFEVARPDGIEILVDHTPQQKELVDGYVKQYGTTLIGRGRILIRANMARLYRSATHVDEGGAALGYTSLPSLETAGRFGGIGATLSDQES